MFHVSINIENVVIPIDIHIFQRGRSTTNQVKYDESEPGSLS